MDEGQLKNNEEHRQTNSPTKTRWIKYIMIVLVVEKIIQHLMVTIAFYFNLKDIASTVAVKPTTLMALGGIVAILFILDLWGFVNQRHWAINLAIGLALFDILGEFVAQGKIGIMINISFIVATILLILSIYYRRQSIK